MTTSTPPPSRTFPSSLIDGATTGDAADALEWLPTISERIVRGFAPLQIVLFGSRARGDAVTESDLDLLVVLPDEWGGVRQREATMAILRALSDLPIAKDIVVTTPEEIARRGHVVGTVLRQAVREGKVIYDRQRNGS